MKKQSIADTIVITRRFALPRLRVERRVTVDSCVLLSVPVLAWATSLLRWNRVRACRRGRTISGTYLSFVVIPYVFA